jgi:hypothetical protein
MWLDKIPIMTVPPIATIFIILLSAGVAVLVLPVIVLVGCFLAGALARVIFFPVRFFLAKLSDSEWGTHVAQPMVAATFFCFLTSRVSQEHRVLTFFILVCIILVFVRIVLWMRAKYRPYFSEILFDERFVYPVWKWISSHRRILAVLGLVPPLRPLAHSLHIIANQIHHRRWQLFLGSLFAFSFYTLPVQLFPYLDRWLEEAIPAALRRNDLQWIVESPWLGKSFQIVGMAYLYLFDWALTVAVVYALVVTLSPLEPRNIFTGINEALRDFVDRRRMFLFAGFFWQNDTHPARTVVCARDKRHKDLFEPMPELIHRQTLNLDGSLQGTWQGNNCRVALVYQSAPANEAEVPNTYCFHYRRLGRSSYLVAVDAHAERFDGSNAKSQSCFQQLGESIGYLVNVRDSLR